MNETHGELGGEFDGFKEMTPPYRPCKTWGFEWYNLANCINMPFIFNYTVNSSRNIKPTWKNTSWLKYSAPGDRKWWAPLAEKVLVLDLTKISSSNFPRAQSDRIEPGIIYSEVPLLVYGNPEVPVTVVCEKNIYLKSINGYFPANNSGIAVKNLGTRDKPSVGIVSAEAVWVVPISEKTGDNYSIPGGSEQVILNNVAIWTTKGFFSLMGLNPRLVVSGSVITMDSMFGKTYHASYEGFGESYYGVHGSRTPSSGLGATDMCYRANVFEGTMAPMREAYVYTKMFRGDDRTTADVIEGPPPHFPVYFENIIEKDCPLEYALKYLELVRSYLEQNQKIPESVITELREASIN